MCVCVCVCVCVQQKKDGDFYEEDKKKKDDEEKAGAEAKEEEGATSGSRIETVDMTTAEDKAATTEAATACPAAGEGGKEGGKKVSSLPEEWKSSTSSLTVTYLSSSPTLHLNGHEYRQCTGWTASDQPKAPRGQVGCEVHFESDRKTGGKFQKEHARAVVAILQRIAAPDTVYLIVVNKGELPRGGGMLYAYPVAQVAVAKCSTTSCISPGVYKALLARLEELPSGVSCEHAPDFGVGAKRVRAQRSLHNAKPPVTAAPAAATTPNGPATPTTTKKGKKKATPTDTGGFKFRCTANCPNGKRCTAAFSTARGLLNHQRMHAKPESSGDEEEEEDSFEDEEYEDDDAQVLKLTLTMLAYEYMTAPVGEFGAKRTEYRSVRGGKSKGKWIASRLVGRTYKKVKLYGGSSYPDEKGDWTVFEYLGHAKAGAPGEAFTIPNFGFAHGFEVELEGERWEIQLGRVLERQCVKHTRDIVQGNKRGRRTWSKSSQRSRSKSSQRSSSKPKRPKRGASVSPPRSPPRSPRAENKTEESTADLTKSWMKFMLDSNKAQADAIKAALEAAAPKATATPTPSSPAASEVKLTASELKSFLRASNGAH